MGIFDRGPITYRARITKGARKLINKYGVLTLHRAKWYYIEQGMKQPIYLSEAMIQKYLRKGKLEKIIEE